MILCPCCLKTSKQWDVWYDCKCFQGRKKSCNVCKLPWPDRDAKVAASMRTLGWDKDPSPGMLDYLTPGWR